MSYRVENIVRKGEIACYKQWVKAPFPTCFLGQCRSRSGCTKCAARSLICNTVHFSVTQ